MSKVVVPLACGFEEIEAVNIIDVLRRADIEVVVASLDDNMQVTGAHKLTVAADMHIKDIASETIDMIVLPGGWGGTKALAEDTNVQRVLKEMDAAHKQIGAICAAPYALNKAGVLKSKYTCYPSVKGDIDKEGYIDDGSMVVQDQNIMTSQGPATAICFALAIVKKLKGEDVYKKIKSGLLAVYC